MEIVIHYYYDNMFIMKYNEYLKDVKGCPFCDKSREPIIENSSAFLTYSLAPYHPDHVLVVPKRHVEHILDLTNDEIKDIDMLQKKGLNILKQLGYSNMCVLVKEGDEKEKSILHTHYHIIPDVVMGDIDHTGADRKVLSNNEIAKLISRIKSVL